MDRQARILLGIRIISAVTNHSAPTLTDLIELRKLAQSDEERNLPPDQLACIIVRREVERYHSAKATARGA